MPISTEHAGRGYPPVPYTVTAGKIAEFAAALGDDNPAYHGPDAIAPPTFGVVLANWDALFSDPELGLALDRTIHVEQKFVSDKPIRAGSEVTATLTIANVRSRGQVDMITLTTLIEDTFGDRLGTMTATLFHTREEAS